jgi:hypothetical protein
MSTHLSYLQASFSLPGSPYSKRRKSRLSLKIAKSLRQHAERQPLVPVHLEALNLPYADDSNAVTPSSDDIKLCNLPSKFSMLARRASMRRAFDDSSRRSSYASVTSRGSHRHSPHSPDKDKLSMLMGAFERNKHHLSPGVCLDKSKLDENVSESRVEIYSTILYNSQFVVLPQLVIFLSPFCQVSLTGSSL